MSALRVVRKIMREILQLPVVWELVDVKMFASSDHDTILNHGLAQAVGAPKISVLRN